MNFSTFLTSCFYSVERRFIFLEYRKRHFSGLSWLEKKKLEKCPYLDEIHRLTPFGKPCILLEHRQPKLCGSSLDFEFIRKCMKINKIRPKFHFLAKIEIQMTHLVFLFINSSPTNSHRVWAAGG